MNIKNINRKFVLVMASFLLLVSSHSAQALTISPARLEVSGDPGTSITKEITLSNDSKTADETYYVTYSNFEAQGETGSPRFVDPTNDLGTWMTSDKMVTLKPNESKKVSFTINIPKDAYSGGHFAAIFFGNNPGDAGQVSVGAKTGTLILLTVTGNVLEAGGLSSFTTVGNNRIFNTLPVSFQYRWKNDGNDRVKPSGQVTIRNMFYLPVATIDANSVSGNVLPHSTRLFDGIVWTNYQLTQGEVIPSSFFGRVSYQWKNFAMGPYFAKLNLAYGVDNKNHSSKTDIFFVFPWQLIIIILVILAIVLFIGKKLLKAYNRNIIAQARMAIKTPDDASHA